MVIKKAIAPTVIGTVAGAAIDGVATGGLLGALIGSWSAIYSQRANDRINELIARLDIQKLDKVFLESEEHSEVNQRCIEIVTKTASDKKRKLVADYLSKIIQSSTINDIHSQFLEDLNALQEFHIQVLAALPNRIDEGIPVQEILNHMPDYIFKKAISDLERFGFLVSKTVWDDDGINSRFTTEYLVEFKKYFL